MTNKERAARGVRLREAHAREVEAMTGADLRRFVLEKMSPADQFAADYGWIAVKAAVALLVAEGLIEPCGAGLTAAGYNARDDQNRTDDGRRLMAETEKRELAEWDLRDREEKIDSLEWKLEKAEKAVQLRDVCLEAGAMPRSKENDHPWIDEIPNKSLKKIFRAYLSGQLTKKSGIRELVKNSRTLAKYRESISNWKNEENHRGEAMALIVEMQNKLK
jgi:hypothetical protein